MLVPDNKWKTDSLEMLTLIVMLDDDAWWWCSMMILYDPWWSLMILDDPWWSLMMLDDAWWCLMMLNDNDRQWWLKNKSYAFDQQVSSIWTKRIMCVTYWNIVEHGSWWISVKSQQDRKLYRCDSLLPYCYYYLGLPYILWFWMKLSNLSLNSQLLIL